MKLLNFLFPVLTGFGAAGINRQRECGAILVVGGAPWEDAQRGNEFDETGINLSSFEVEYFPEVNERLPSNVGETRARAMSDKFSRKLSVEGEVVGADGVMAFTLATACAFANDVDDFGDGSGDFLMDNVKIKQGRSEWRMFTGQFSSDPGCTV